MSGPGSRAQGPGAPHRLQLFGLGFLLLLSFAAGPTGAERPAMATCTPDLSLTSSSVAGQTPLLVSFQLTVFGGPATDVNWSFGDGSGLDGSAPADLAPSHAFVGVGDFRTQVRVHGPFAVQSCSTVVSVRAAPLRASLSAVPSHGPAPLTVHVTASVTGGTGTFTSAVWDFADGGSGSGFDLNYTFAHAGSYRLAFQVTDDAGAIGTGSVWVNVTDPSAGSAPAGSAGAPGFVPWTAWFAGTVAIGTMLLAAVWGVRARRGRGEVVPVATLGGGAGSNGFSLSPAASLSEAIQVESSPAPPPATSVSLGTRASPGGTSSDPGWSDPAPHLPDPGLVPPARLPAKMTPGDLRLHERVVLHLAAQGALRADDIPPEAFTQAGMTDQLLVKRNLVSNALRRLTLAGMVAPSLRHVQGRPRRLQVYELTPLGESLARQLRRRGPPNHLRALE